MANSIADEPPTIRAALPFQPNQFQLFDHPLPLFETNEVPRYLFRIHGPNTAGETSDSHVIPPASTFRGGIDNIQDIFRLRAWQAATRLNGHLRWIPEHEPQCNFMSWTSSLLFALQYGLYRHSELREPMSDISLLIVDTCCFPRGTFIKDMEIMGFFAPHMHDPHRDLEDFIQLRTNGMGYYFGEYLTQGDMDIKGRCAVTNMQEMIRAGSFGLKPELSDKSKWNLLAKRVLELRQCFEPPGDVPSATHAEVWGAITVAKICFGDHWDLPVALMLLALKRRQKEDPIIMKEFATTFGEEIQDLHLQDIKIDAASLPEVKQIRRLLSDVCGRTACEGINSLINPFENLELSHS